MIKKIEEFEEQKKERPRCFCSLTAIQIHHLGFMNGFSLVNQVNKSSHNSLRIRIISIDMKQDSLSHLVATNFCDIDCEHSILYRNDFKTSEDPFPFYQ